MVTQLLSTVTDLPVVNLASRSTLIMTGLLGIGLFFFLRASGKDRVETRIYQSSIPLQTFAQTVRDYLHDRAYTLTQVDDKGIATFIGQGQPSWFLTVFLSGLAMLGCVCLIVVFRYLYPDTYQGSWALLGLAPLAGWYYRARNQRQETIKLRIEAPTAAVLSRMTISGHRDELDTMESALQLDWAEE